MSDQAAGLRARLSPDAVPLRVVGEPGDDALMQALAVMPTRASHGWRVLRQGERTSGKVAWLAWLDAEQLDVPDLYRRLKLAQAEQGPAGPVLLWLYDGRLQGLPRPADVATDRLIDNLGVTVERFLGFALTRDIDRWCRGLPATRGQFSSALGQ